MKVVAFTELKSGRSVIEKKYKQAYGEVLKVIEAVDAMSCKTKESQEKTMPGTMLYSPRQLNDKFKEGFKNFGWQACKKKCDYKYGHFSSDYKKVSSANAYREMDFISPSVKLGVEVQFGKYAFMVYNVCAKMTIFHNLGLINAGIEIVPTKLLADEMSTGVSFFEQIAWDLEKRGAADIDIPVLVLGIDV